MAESQVSPSAPHIAAPEVHPSFTKGIFLGELYEDFVFPFPDPPAEDQETLRMVLEAFRAFATDHIDPRRHDREGVFQEDVRRGVHELGLMGVNIPQEYGGFGASAVVANRIFGEIGATDPALAVYFGAHQSIGCKGIVLFGNEAQKQKYLPRCATGETIAAFCLTEPGSGSDAQAMQTTAVLNPDGTAYTLNGTKIWISNAGYASLFTVFAKVPVQVNGETKQRVTAFIVDAHAPGVRLGAPEKKMGIKASDTRAVFFENVQVPADDVLGGVGHGFKIALEVLNTGRLGLATASAHGARTIMRKAIAYANTRTQFGRSLGSFEMIQRKIAMNAAECYAVEAACLVTASMVDRGGIDFSLETAICKVAGAELVFQAANDALQIAGGVGYSAEYPYEQAVRDARINLIFEGTDEILRILIALSGLQHPADRLKTLGEALHHPIRSAGVLGSYLAERTRHSFERPAFTQMHESLAQEANLIATLIYTFASNVERAIMRHGAKIQERQLLQERMANVAIDVYLMTATLARASRAAVHGAADAEATAAEIDCAKLFIHTAFRRARRTIHGLRNNQDALVTAVATRSLTTRELGPPTPLVP
ncbi:MAG TPA: acyl-CoA dehydrogenase family protein [Gemmatimonadaceae bacterium]|jgi:acyl-CoA dehydrogenase family protein 9|nr:acyl-CoA dehydrogenase family protein [Gemmatimonadaceae bacterium]